MAIGRLLLLCALAGLLIPTVSAERELYWSLEDRFVDIPLDAFEVEGGCGPAGAPDVKGQIHFDEESDSFTFMEAEPAGPESPTSLGPRPGDGTSRSVCATASVTLSVPAGTEHIHVRFDADRVIRQAVTLDYHMPQELRVIDAATDRTIEQLDIFPWDDPSHDRQRFSDLGPGASPFIAIPPGVKTIMVQWYFEDLGMSSGSDETVVSGQDYSATVWNPVVEFSLGPAPINGVTTDERRKGTTSFMDTIVPASYAPDDNRTNLRIRGPLSSQFSHVVAPSGARIDDTGILPPGAEYGPQWGFVLIERNSAEGYAQITIPDAILATHGPGLYQAVFTAVTEAEPFPALMAFNAGLAALPLALAALALQRIREFQREAFGGYRRTATNLMVTLALVLAYYIITMAGAIVAGWFTVAATLPPSPGAGLMYLQVALAMAAFWWLWLTGRAMVHIVRPPAL